MTVLKEGWAGGGSASGHYGNMKEGQLGSGEKILPLFCTAKEPVHGAVYDIC